ncbi:hypothetical protein LPJ61_005900, partial [Coemansia biformis]
MAERVGRAESAAGQRGRTSSVESSLATEEYGEQFIKTTDDTRINRAMGVGRCALHPCLTRRATIGGPDDLRPPAMTKELGGGQASVCVEEPRHPGPLHSEQELADAAAESALADELARCGISGAADVGRPNGGGGGGSGTTSSTSARRAPPVVVPTPRRPPSDSGLQLELKRKELARAGKRHSEATAQAVRSMERGLRSGMDTPTVDLMQTAVSVREVSKLIGRTVVQMSNVRRIMIVTKPNDTSLVSLTRDLAVWLVERPTEDDAAPMVVYIEEFIAQHRNFNLPRMLQRYPALEQCLQLWTPELCARSPEIFDFVVTLGGDGTVLYTSWLFQKTVPPIIPFHLGSLGFLTVFDHRHARRVLDSAIHAGVRINLRMRFNCTVYRLAEEVDPAHANVLVDAADCNRLISHKIATQGLQSDTEPVFSGDEDCSGTPEAAKLAAINSMARPKASRAFAGATRRRASTASSSSSSSLSAAASTSATTTAVAPVASAPVSTGSSSTRHGASRSHARRRSEAGNAAADAGSADAEAHQRTGPRRTTSTSSAPRTLRKRSSNT